MITLKHVHSYYGPSPYASVNSVLVKVSSEDSLLAHIDKLTKSAETKLAEHFHSLVINVNSNVSPLHQLVSTLSQLSYALLTEVRGLLEQPSIIEDEDHLLVLPFHNESTAMRALKLSAELLLNHRQHSKESLQTQLEQFWLMCRKTHPDYQSAILMSAARELQIPVLPLLPQGSFYQYGWGCRARVFRESHSNSAGLVGSTIAKDKALSKRVFAEMGLPIADDAVFYSEEQAADALQTIGFPCVVKPLDGSGGKGVTAHIMSDTQLKWAIQHARKFSEGALLLEKHISGFDHRLLVIEGRFVLAIQRRPASVVGDGQHTILELIDNINKDRSLNLVKSKYLRKINLDAALINHLATQNITLDSVLPEGTHVYLRSNSNISTGGECTEVTKNTHPTLIQLIEMFSHTMGLNNVGFDYMTEDVSLDPTLGNGFFIEMNVTPGLDAFTAIGISPQQCGQMLLGELPGRIPVDLIISESPDTIYASAVPQRENNMMVYNNAIYLQNFTLNIKSTLPWAAVHSALKNRQLEALTILTTPAELCKFGLPVDALRDVHLNNCTLAEPWLTVLKNHSAALYQHKEPTE